MKLQADLVIGSREDCGFQLHDMWCATYDSRVERHGLVIQFEVQRDVFTGRLRGW